VLFPEPEGTQQWFIDLYWVNVWRVAVGMKGMLGQEVGGWNFASKVSFSTAEMLFSVKKCMLYLNIPHLFCK